MVTTRAFLQAIFPSYLQDDLAVVYYEIWSGPHAPKYDVTGSGVDRTVNIGNDVINLAGRIYGAEIQPRNSSQPLSSTQHNLLSCYFSRSHDGYRREHYLRKIVGLDEVWVVPFVLQLVGEYVLDIVELINEQADTLLAMDSYRQFIKNNPEFISLLRARVSSYWNCYYREDYPVSCDYPGSLFVSRCEKLL